MDVAAREARVLENDAEMRAAIPDCRAFRTLLAIHERDAGSGVSLLVPSPIWEALADLEARVEKLEHVWDWQ